MAAKPTPDSSLKSNPSTQSEPEKPSKPHPVLTKDAALLVLQQAFYEAQQAGIEFLIVNAADPRNPGDPAPAPALNLSLIGVQIGDGGNLYFA